MSKIYFRIKYFEIEQQFNMDYVLGLYEDLHESKTEFFLKKQFILILYPTLDFVLLR